MGADCVYSIIGKKPFDLVIKNVKIVNVFTESIVEGDVAVTGGVHRPHRLPLHGKRGDRRSGPLRRPRLHRRPYAH